MAIAIPARTLVGEYSWIWVGDSALDHDADGLEGKYRLYVETGDEKHLPFKPGQEPTRLRLRHLSRSESRFVLDAVIGRRGAQMGAVRLAASMALAGLGGLRGADGKELKIDRAVNAEGFQVCPEDVMEVLDLVPGLVNAIGNEAITRSQLSPK